MLRKTLLAVLCIIVHMQAQTLTYEGTEFEVAGDEIQCVFTKGLQDKAFEDDLIIPVDEIERYLFIEVVRSKGDDDYTPGYLTVSWINPVYPASYGRVIRFKERFETLEPPWNENKSEETVDKENIGKNEKEKESYSRCRAGTYMAKIRRKETSKHNYDFIELKDVPGRTAIQIHRGDRPSHTSGCILIGERRSKDDPKILLNSEEALSELIDIAESRIEPRVIIVNIVDAPGD